MVVRVTPERVVYAMRGSGEVIREDVLRCIKQTVTLPAQNPTLDVFAYSYAS